jgi:hypothetical protein
MKFKKGDSGIHIKPENKGKFTATKKATGKSTEELTHSSNPVTKKRAVFAQNAAKWKHEDGSKNVKGFPDLNKDGKISKADVLVGRGIIPTKKMQIGTKATKATKDSTRFFKNDFSDKKRTQLEAEKKGYSENYETNKRTFLKGESARKAGEDLKRQANKGKTGFDRNGYPVDEKMCGSKSMKYQAGSKSMKATPDSTNYFKKKVIEESFKKTGGRYSAFNEENSKIDRKIVKLGEDIDRQELKGKPGYDSNGHPLKKKSSGTSGSYAEGTKAIKFKKPMMKRADGSTSQRGLYDNIRANKGSGKKPTSEMLKQEKKIKFGK